MDKSVFRETYIVAVCVRLIYNYHGPICLAVFDAFFQRFIFLQNVDKWLLSFLAYLFESISQRLIVFRHEDDVWVLIKSACHFFTEQIHKLIEVQRCYTIFLKVFCRDSRQQSSKVHKGNRFSFETECVFKQLDLIGVELC